MRIVTKPTLPARRGNDLTVPAPLGNDWLRIVCVPQIHQCAIVISRFVSVRRELGNELGSHSAPPKAGTQMPESSAKAGKALCLAA